MPKHVVAPVSDIPDGTRKLVSVDGRTIVVFNIAGEFFALNNRCPHKGGSLCDGRLSGRLEASEPGDYRYSPARQIIRCPWHQWEFDIRTGKSWCDPQRLRVRTHAVTIEPGANVVEGPYTAETFPVSVENDYVVVEA
jgi:3-phenylpropionate/trans-cinnamate dioxygenase ferredoxin subunit